MVDPEAVTARLDRLAGLLVELERIGSDGKQAYLSDMRTRLAVQHALQLAIQVCADVGAHLIAEEGLEAPSDYRGIFGALRERGLDEELAARLSRAAGMRNLLVHQYLELDDEQVWEALGRLDDLRAFSAWASQIADESADA